MAAGAGARRPGPAAIGCGRRRTRRRRRSPRSACSSPPGSTPSWPLNQLACICRKIGASARSSAGGVRRRWRRRRHRGERGAPAGRVRADRTRRRRDLRAVGRHEADRDLQVAARPAARSGTPPSASRTRRWPVPRRGAGAAVDGLADAGRRRQRWPARTRRRQRQPAAGAATASGAAAGAAGVAAPAGPAASRSRRACATARARSPAAWRWPSAGRQRVPAARRSTVELRHPAAARAVDRPVRQHHDVARQDHLGDRAALDVGPQLDPDAVPGGEPADHGETHQPERGHVDARRLGQPAVERLHLVLGHAEAAVLDLDHHVVADPPAVGDHHRVRRREPGGVVEQFGDQPDHVVDRERGDRDVGVDGAELDAVVELHFGLRGAQRVDQQRVLAARRRWSRRRPAPAGSRRCGASGWPGGRARRAGPAASGPPRRARSGRARRSSGRPGV